MSRGIEKLSALATARAVKAGRRGRLGDGGGLFLQIARNGSASWVYRYRVGGRERWHGLGPVEAVSLAAARLAGTIRGPRLYEQESLPFAPSWSEVQRILADTATDLRRDVRDRAILMLLAIYGMRSGEVASLRLDQLDWQHRVIRLFRLKRRQPQTYPLVLSVAEALAHYIDTVRPRTSHQQIFIGLQSPQRPLTPSAIYDVVSRRFLALGIQVAHRGPHALRHACAARLVADGLTLKEIGDHLGHRSTSATRTYAKVDLIALREVGDFDLGDLQ